MMATVASSSTFPTQLAFAAGYMSITIRPSFLLLSVLSIFSIIIVLALVFPAVFGQIISTMVVAATSAATSAATVTAAMSSIMVQTMTMVITVSPLVLASRIAFYILGIIYWLLIVPP